MISNGVNALMTEKKSFQAEIKETKISKVRENLTSK